MGASEPGELAAQPVAFISHHSMRVDVARQLSTILARHGIKGWLAPDDIEPGMAFDQVIIEKIRDSDLILLLFCARSDQSKHVKREIMLAEETGKLIYPIRLEAIQPSGLAYWLQDYQWTDWLDQRDATIERLVQTIKKHVHGPSAVAAQAGTASGQGAPAVGQLPEAAMGGPVGEAEPSASGLQRVLANRKTLVGGVAGLALLALLGILSLRPASQQPTASPDAADDYTAAGSAPAANPPIARTVASAAAVAPAAPPSEAAQLVGRWKLRPCEGCDEEYVQYNRYFPNGTCETQIMSNGVETSRQECKWSVEEDRLIVDNNDVVREGKFRISADKMNVTYESQFDIYTEYFDKIS